jgi:hypothetical protein
VGLGQSGRGEEKRAKHLGQAMRGAMWVHALLPACIRRDCTVLCFDSRFPPLIPTLLETVYPYTHPWVYTYIADSARLAYSYILNSIYLLRLGSASEPVLNPAVLSIPRCIAGRKPCPGG